MEVPDLLILDEAKGHSDLSQTQWLMHVNRYLQCDNHRGDEVVEWRMETCQRRKTGTTKDSEMK